MRSSLPIVAALLAVLAAPAFAQLDVVAVIVSGPSTAGHGQSVSVFSQIVENLGNPVTFTYEYRLSTDMFITIADPLVASFTSSVQGPRSDVMTIPASIAPGNYVWGLRVLAVPGEVNTGNNVAVGGNVTVSATLPPSVTSVAPQTGPITGGTAVTITGTGFSGATGVTFAGVPATAITVSSATSITCTTPASPNAQVRFAPVAVTSAAGTGSLSNAFLFDHHLPGSGEDVLLKNGINSSSTNPNFPLRQVNPGDVIKLDVESPANTLNLAPAVIIAQPFPTAGPQPLGIPGFPEVHMDLFSIVVILDGNATPLGQVRIGNGLSFSFFYPGGASGFTTRVQALAISSSTTNGFFAITNGNDFVFM